jgi:hypothetical protein
VTGPKLLTILTMISFRKPKRLSPKKSTRLLGGLSRHRLASTANVTPATRLAAKAARQKKSEKDSLLRNQLTKLHQLFLEILFLIINFFSFKSDILYHLCNPKILSDIIKVTWQIDLFSTTI